VSHSPAFIIGCIAAWYLGSGLFLALVSAAPGALLDRETGRPIRLDPTTWVVVVAFWPWFFVAWTLNTWVRR
jgi:hypothetical protein